MHTSKLSYRKLVALLAMMVNAFASSLDGMLPALPQIATDLSPETPKRAQEILVWFMIDMGVGTFVAGPISDAFGQRKGIIIGMLLYFAIGLVGFVSSSLEIVLTARFFQGLGAAAPRIVGQAIIRDLFSGRRMVQPISYIMVILALTPALAPLVGEWIMFAFNWRGIILGFVIFAEILLSWFFIRLGETLPVKKRRVFELNQILPSMEGMYLNKQVRLAICTQTLSYATLFASIILIQPIFDQSFDEANCFAKWFAFIAIVSALSSLMNTRLVIGFGVRTMVLFSLLGQMVACACVLIYFVWGPSLDTILSFVVYIIWQTGVFFQVGFTLGILNALASQPMWHIASFAASVTGGISTVVFAILASIINRLFDRAPLPLILCSV